MSEIHNESRRGFIKKIGYLSVGFSLLGNHAFSSNFYTETSNNLPPDDQINAWLKILENGKIEILTGKHELGQGISVALKQITAEELNTEIKNITLKLAETDVTPNEWFTAGSASIESSGMSIRNAAASAREILLKKAAALWSVDVNEINLENGKIFSAEKTISFYDLLNGEQFEEKAFKPDQYLAKTVRKWVGKPVFRTEIEDIIRGKEVYVQDLKFPDMVHARVVRPSGYTSKLQSLDESSIKEIPGFLKLVKIGSFIGVIAEEEYQAVKLKNSVKALTKWENDTSLPVDIPLKEYLKTLPAETQIEENKGSFQTAINDAQIIHSASYSKPYIMHAANGPSCAVAYFKEGQLQIWCHSQGVYPLRKSIASLLDIKEDYIHIKAVSGSGCYGHNGADDVAAEVALIAQNYPGRHIRLQWMRDDEHGWEPYGTAMIMELKASLSSDSKIEGWKYDFWSDGHSTRPTGDANSLLPARFLDRGHGVPVSGFKGGAVRNSVPYYDIANLETTSHIFEGPLRKSALRGLGAYANVFAIESFMDELAYKAQVDPVTFRLMHLNDERAKECITKLKNKTKAIKLSHNEGVGYAFARYKNEASYCAVAAQVEVNRTNGSVLVKKMWAVIDPGECINPDGLKNQTEGGMIQSASWALKEEVKFDENHITSLDWNSYPIYRFTETPETDVEVIDNFNEPPSGAGEAAQGPATAAVVNAIFNATGVRIRDLPVNKDLLVLT
ncbi:MAG: molybdopterin cofactor-binding domain-containing protein [Leeuwenhoekiella sp.]